MPVSHFPAAGIFGGPVFPGGPVFSGGPVFPDGPVFPAAFYYPHTLTLLVSFSSPGPGISQRPVNKRQNDQQTTARIVFLQFRAAVIFTISILLFSQ
jgi:hypothetical protein